MSKLEQLIEELCPCGVEYRKIKDCYKRLRGTPITAGKMKEIECEEGEIRVFAGGKTVINAKEKDIPNANITRVPAVLVQSRGVIDAVYFESPFTFKNEMWAYTHDEKVSVKYLYYVLKNNIQGFRDAASGMGSLPQISLTATEDFLIPLPHIEIQREIVRILDNFIELTAELTVELTDRKKQYEYYREDLLNSSSDITMESIDDIFSTVTDYVAAGSFASIAENVSYKNDPDYAQLVRTMDIKSAFTKGNNVYVDKTAFDFLWRVNLDEESIIMPNIGVNCGEVYYVEPENLPYKNNVLGPNAILLRSDRYNNKYLYYLLTTHSFQKALKVIISPGGQTKFNKTGLKNLKLPIPYANDLEKSLAEQERIIGLLDRFDTLCNDISKGLPAEIDERQKQYEYYRDKLLTFKNIDDEV